ncbi:MAG: hypothetical protein ACXWP5_06040 [Bdellovibrionota bacterium]
MLRSIWHIALILLALLAPLIARALTPEEKAELERLKGKIKVGMEIELVENQLLNITPFLDFEAYQQANPDVVKRVPQEMIDRYLEDLGNFRFLPEKLRTKLTRGLSHLKVKVHEGTVPTLEIKSGLVLPNSATILGRDGQPLAKERPLIEVPAIPQGIPQNLRAKWEWDEVRRRWRALPEKERRPAIRIQRLSEREKAQLLTDGPPNEDGIYKPAIEAKLVPARADLPEETRELFSRLEWDSGRHMVEFRHRVPLEDPLKYLADLESFATKAGVWKEMQNPAIRSLILFSYHNHLSILGAINLTNEAIAMNAIRFLEQPWRSGGMVAYNAIPTYKGLGRLVPDWTPGSTPGILDRYETRMSLLSPEQELLRTARWMSSSDGLVYRDLAAQIQETMTPEFVRELFSKRTGDLKELIAALNLLRAKIPIDPWVGFAKALPDLIKHPTAMLRENALVYTWGLIESPSVHGAVESLLKSPEGMDLFVRSLSGLNVVVEMGPNAQSLLASILQSGSLDQKGRVLRFLESQSRAIAWGDSLKSAVAGLMKHQSNEIRRTTEATLKSYFRKFPGQCVTSFLEAEEAALKKSLLKK